MYLSHPRSSRGAAKHSSAQLRSSTFIEFKSPFFLSLSRVSLSLRPRSTLAFAWHRRPRRISQHHPFPSPSYRVTPKPHGLNPSYTCNIQNERTMWALSKNGEGAIDGTHQHPLPRLLSYHNIIPMQVSSRLMVTS